MLLLLNFQSPRAKAISQAANAPTPLLFDFGVEGSRQHLHVKLDGCDWAKELPVDAVGHSSVLELPRERACTWKVMQSHFACRVLYLFLSF